MEPQRSALGARVANAQTMARADSAALLSDTDSAPPQHLPIQIIRNPEASASPLRLGVMIRWHEISVLVVYDYILIYICSQNDIIMDIALEKKAHVFRLPSYLLDKLKELATKDRRSLNNYVEGLLLDAVYNEPNDVTRASFEEAKAGKLEGPIDTTSVDTMLKSMGL